MPQHDRPATCRVRGYARILKMQGAPKGAKEMTTTTRKARKAPWAVALTALLAALALLTGTLGFVGSAQATEDISVTICHATDSRTNPYRVITVNGSSINEVRNALFNGHGDHDGVVFSATLPKHQKWGDIIPAFGDFPGKNTDAVGWIATGCNIPGVYDGEGAYEAIHGRLCYNDMTYGPFTSGLVTREATSTVSKEAADEAAYQLAVADATAILNRMLADYPEHTDGTCPGTYVGEGAFEATHGVLCYNDVTYGPFTSGLVTREATSTVSKEAADEAAYQLAVADATAILNRMLADYPEHTDGTCPVRTTFEKSATAGGTVDYCTVEGTTVSITYSGSATMTSTVSSEDALFKAQVLATDRANADLQAQLPTGATPGACAVTPPVEPATVAAVQPATVPVPAHVTLPARIPAGEGPTVPTYMLALLALGATALAVSTVHLVRTTR